MLIVFYLITNFCNLNWLGLFASISLYMLRNTLHLFTLYLFILCLRTSQSRGKKLLTVSCLKPTSFDYNMLLKKCWKNHLPLFFWAYISLFCIYYYLKLSDKYEPQHGKGYVGKVTDNFWGIIHIPLAHFSLWDSSICFKNPMTQFWRIRNFLWEGILSKNHSTISPWMNTLLFRSKQIMLNLL